MEVSSDWKTLKQAILGRQPMCSNKETMESPAPATKFALFYPSLYCFYFAMIVLLASCLLLLIFETFRTMFGLSVCVCVCGGGGSKQIAFHDLSSKFTTYHS